jgi:hypothetical protein
MKASTKMTLGAVLMTAILMQPAAALAQGTAFTYQGRLDTGGAPAHGLYDLRFTVHDAASGGNQWGPALTNAPVAVSNGLFTVTLDFGFGVFNGGARWLEIGIRSNGTASAFTSLAPRQAVLPAPYAFWAANASQAVTVSGTVPASGLNGLYSNPVTFNNPANSFSGNGAGLSNVNAVTLGGRTAAQFWQTGGNAGTTPGADFLGTTDNQPVLFRANNQRALRLEPTADGANLIGGHPNNVVFNGVVGAVIAGGGASNLANEVSASHAVVGGGLGNAAGGLQAVVGGGRGNVASGVSATIGGGAQNLASSLSATVAGGAGNTASNLWSFVGGGDSNTAGGDRSAVVGGLFNLATRGGAFIGGGERNTVTNSHAVVPGGYLNTAGGRFSLAAGRQAKALHEGSFVWADSQAADFASTAPNQFAVRAAGGMFVDGWLGVGHPNAPSWPLEVEASQAVGRFTTTNSPNGSVVVLKNSSASPDYLGAINFDGIEGTPGQIGYLATNAMIFRVGDVERMTLDASGLRVNGQPALLGPAPGQPLEFVLNSASAWRLVPNGTSPNIIGGYSGNIVSNGVVGAFIGGGGNASFPNRVGGNYGSVLGGLNNTASGEFSTAMGIGTIASGARATAMGWGTKALGSYSTAMGVAATASGETSTAMGLDTKAFGYISTAMGFETTASGYISTAMGSQTAATNNDATAMGRRSIAGGSASTAMGLETVANGYASTAMGSQTLATNNDSTAMGRLTLAGGSASTAMGYRARALHNGTFVWADQQDADFDSTAANQFSLRASGGVRLNNDTSLSFGNQTRQMINLWNTQYAIGVQANAAYFRTDNEFLWYRGGSHSDTFGDPGVGGTQLMRLGNSGNLVIAGTLSQGSDRAIKQDFAAVNPQEILDKVVALPLQTWAYTNDASRRHLGPVAQDFHAAFGLNGDDDKHIATVDADGVALAAIQGLNQKLEARSRELEAENTALKARLDRLERLLETRLAGGAQ